MASGSVGNGGFGLGLYICSTMAKVLGGKITLSSVLGKGSEFRFILPLESVVFNDMPQVTYKERDLPKGLNLVVIDDNVITLAHIRSFFSTEQKVFTFSDPILALDHIRSNVPDCVITDIHMPQMDGWAVLREIRENQATSTVPVIKFMSSSSLGGDTDEHGNRAYDFDGSIEKPIDRQILFAFLMSIQCIDGTKSPLTDISFQG